MGKLSDFFDKSAKQAIDDHKYSVGMDPGFVQSSVPPGWTPADEAALQHEADQRRRRTEQLRQDNFMKQPLEVREEILRIYREKLVRDSINEIGHASSPPSAKEDDLATRKAKHENFKRKQGYSGGAGNFLSAHDFIYEGHYGDDPLTHFPPYEELARLHADKSTREIILNDKD